MKFIENTFGSPELQRITGLHDGLLRQLRHRGYLRRRVPGGQVEYDASETARVLAFATLLQIGMPPKLSADLDLPSEIILDWAQFQRGAILDPQKIAGHKLPRGEGKLGTYTPSNRYWLHPEGLIVGNLNRHFRAERSIDKAVSIIFDLKSMAKHLVKMAA